MPDYHLPADIRRALSILLAARDKREETMAACALEAWRLHFNQPLPGISAPAHKARLITHIQADPDSASQSFFCPAFSWRDDDVVALLFSDQSAIVARETCGRLQAIPMVFRIRKESRDLNYAVPVIRSDRKPEAKVTFRLQKDQTCLPKHSATDPDLRKKDGGALSRIESDLRALAPLFDQLPKVVQPFGASPPDAEGVVTLPFLSQRWFSQEEAATCQSWAEELADWIALHHPQYSEVQVTISTRKPEMLGRPYILTEHIEYAFLYAKPNGVSTKSGFGNVREIIADPRRLELPIPEDRLYQLVFSGSGRSRHSCSSPKVVTGKSSATISKHRELIVSRFGAPKQDAA